MMFENLFNNPDSKVHGANIGPIWGRQDPGGSHVGPMNFEDDVLNIVTHYFKSIPGFVIAIRKPSLESINCVVKHSH